MPPMGPNTEKSKSPTNMVVWYLVSLSVKKENVYYYVWIDDVMYDVTGLENRHILIIYV